jgi:hypothetical protein
MMMMSIGFGHCFIYNDLLLLGAGGRERMPESSRNAMASLNNDRWRYWNLYYKIERKTLWTTYAPSSLCGRDADESIHTQ